MLVRKNKSSHLSCVGVDRESERANYWLDKWYSPDS